jgi:uncharacterized ParB-like nuclease family protein
LAALLVQDLGGSSRNPEGWKPSKKGTEFEQPLAAHRHWHIDVSYIKISGTFYYLCNVFDGCSRYIVNQIAQRRVHPAGKIERLAPGAKEDFGSVIGAQSRSEMVNRKPI